MPISEEILILLLKDDNTSAFEEIYNRYNRKVYAFAFKMLNSEDEANEIVQNVFVRIWEIRKNIDVKKSFNSYLFKISKNIILNQWRKNSNHQIYLNHVISGTNLYYLEESSIEYSELLSIMEELISRLPEKRKTIFLMSRNEGYSYKVIAEKLKISLNTVETQISRSLEFLRKELKKKYI